MKYLSVCSGISAASVAWKTLGWQCAGFFEVEPFPCAALAHHYPNVPNFGDLTKHHESDLASFDVLEGGTPCQGFSVAGLRGGLDDPRSQLAFHFVEIAARNRPAWLVWENVPGVFSSTGGADFAEFLGALTGRKLSVPEGGWKNSGHVDGISSAYGVAWRVLDAQYFGVPQRRRRVFVVGYLGDWKRAAAVLFERESLCGNPPPRREAGQTVAPTIRAGAPNGGAGHGARSGDSKDELIVPVLAHALRAQSQLSHQEDRDNLVVSPSVTSKWPAEVAPTLDAHFGDKQGLEDQHINGGGGLSVPGPSSLEVTHSLRAEGFDASEDGTGRGTPLVPVAYRTSGNCGAWETGDKTDALTTGTDPNSHVLTCGVDGYNGTLTGDVAATMSTRGSSGTASGPQLMQRSAVRRLTPRECERLQGFPDDYTLIQWRGKSANECPDGPRYKALGNSMAVPVMRWIGERIQLVQSMAKESPPIKIHTL